MQTELCYLWNKNISFYELPHPKSLHNLHHSKINWLHLSAICIFHKIINMCSKVKLSSWFLTEVTAKPHVRPKAKCEEIRFTCRTTITIWKSAFFFLLLREVLSRLMDFLLVGSRPHLHLWEKNRDLKSKYLEIKASKHCWNIPLLPNGAEFH